MTDPPADAAVVALTLPLFVTAGPVAGTAVALARAGVETYYLVDNAALDGPPVWLHEREVERCAVAPMLVKSAAP
jgi:hypothetical protein